MLAFVGNSSSDVTPGVSPAKEDVIGDLEKRKKAFAEAAGVGLGVIQEGSLVDTKWSARQLQR